jgi:Fe-S cluster biogenesis protein NfuA
MADQREDVEAALERIRAALQVDGGDVQLMGIEDGLIKVKLQGSCAGCPFSQMTLKNFIERELKKSVASVKSVVAV